MLILIWQIYYEVLNEPFMKIFYIQTFYDHCLALYNDILLLKVLKKTLSFVIN